MTDYLQAISLLNSSISNTSSNHNICPLHGCNSNSTFSSRSSSINSDNSFENILLNLASMTSSSNNLIANVPMGYSSLYSSNNIFGDDISSQLIALNLLNTLYGPSINQTLYNPSINQTQNITSSVDTTSHSFKTAKAIEMAKAQLGKPYVWGATGPNKFDCSGLTQYIYKHAYGKDIPRVSYEQAKVGQAVDIKDLQPGDLVFFDTLNKGRVSHVGIYIGNNEFIHASNRRDGVKKSTLTGVFIDKYKGARRP